ncbi:MAG: redoxin family protein [Candidatus Nanohaloarchaea archaeon]|nr:redoxin family protein [Candidatus Nanohaloarchaea archaeon]
MERNILLAGAAVLVAVAGAAVVLGGNPATTSNGTVDRETGATASGWKSVTLTDVRTGETFTIAGFDRPVLVESFAVWCPTCTRQQQELKQLHEQVGDRIVSVSIDTDPNEDASKVRKHIHQNGFDWRYAVASADFLRPFIDAFGRDVVNAPLAPMVLVCPNGTARQLPNGVKPADSLQQTVAQRC